jgi:hypothetical protein
MLTGAVSAQLAAYMGRAPGGNVWKTKDKTNGGQKL